MWTYDCSNTGYPEVCWNTLCYFRYSKKANVFQLTYDDSNQNRRKPSLSGLKTERGYYQDEGPMNKA